MLLVGAVCDLAAFDYDQGTDRKNPVAWAARVLANHFAPHVASLEEFVADRRKDKGGKKKAQCRQRSPSTEARGRAEEEEEPGAEAAGTGASGNEPRAGAGMAEDPGAEASRWSRRARSQAAEEPWSGG